MWVFCIYVIFFTEGAQAKIYRHAQILFFIDSMDTH